jgi:hypothetical protein
MGLRFKTNNINAVSPNLFLVYNYGLEISHKNRLASYNVSESYGYLTFPLNSIFFKNVNFLSANSLLGALSNFYLNFFTSIYFVNNSFSFLSAVLTNAYLFAYFLINFVLNFSTFNFVKLTDILDFENKTID